MGVDFLDKAKELIDQHDDKIDAALDKVGEAAKQRFAEHGEMIDKVIDEAKKRTGQGDTTEGAPGPDAAPTQPS